MCALNPNLITQKVARLRATASSCAACARRCAPPRAVRARLGVLLGGLSAIQLEKARLVAAAVEYRAEEAIGRGPVRAQRLDDRVAPGGGVGVEVLIDELAGEKASADAQEGARNLAVGRGVLTRDVLDQARSPVHGVRAPRAHGATKFVDARAIGQARRVGIGGSSSSSSRGHLGWFGLIHQT
jgi:hypothetical protein